MPIDPLLTVRPLGVRLTVNLSTVLVVGLMAGGATAGLDPGPNDLPRWVLGSVAALLTFIAAIAIRSAAEIWASRRLGARVRQLHILGFGGVLLLARNDDAPRRECLVGIAGMAPLLVITLGFLGTSFMSGASVPVDAWWTVAVVTWCSLVTLHLLPGLGLSGGRVLRSLVWYLTDNAVSGARAAAAYGYLIGAGLMALGLGFIGLGGARPYLGLWAILAGWQLSGTSRIEAHRTRWLSIATTHTLAEIVQPATRIPASSSIDLAIDPLLTSGPEHPLLVIDADGEPVGILRLDDLRGLRRSEWHRQPIDSVATPLSGTLLISSDALVVDAIDLMDTHDASTLVVTNSDASYRPVAVITRATLLGRLHERRPAQRVGQGRQRRSGIDPD